MDISVPAPTHACICAAPCTTPSVPFSREDPAAEPEALLQELGRVDLPVAVARRVCTTLWVALQRCPELATEVPAADWVRFLAEALRHWVWKFAFCGSGF